MVQLWSKVEVKCVYKLEICLKPISQYSGLRANSVQWMVLSLRVGSAAVAVWKRTKEGERERHSEYEVLSTMVEET